MRHLHRHVQHTYASAFVAVSIDCSTLSLSEPPPLVYFKLAQLSRRKEVIIAMETVCLKYKSKALPSIVSTSKVFFGIKY